MITSNNRLKTCAGIFDPTVPRADLPVFFDLGTGSPFRVYRYQPGVTGELAAMTTKPRRAPYAVREWLIRNAEMALRGQEPIDIDGAVGTSFMSSKGWGQSGRIARVPRSLIVMGEQTLNPFDPDWLAALDAAIGPLRDIGVDVYSNVGQTAGNRFLRGIPVTDATSFSAGTNTNLIYLDCTSADPADIQGGDVMFAMMGFYSTGYAINANAEAGYVSYISSGSGYVFDRTTSLFGTTGGVDIVFQDETASIEAAMLAPIAAKCRNFSFDIYASNQDPVGGTNPTVEDCDAAFRNGIAGNVYHYINTGPGDYSTIADQIVANALAFFPDPSACYTVGILGEQIMAHRMWGGTNPTAGGAYGVGEYLMRDPDQMAALKVQEEGQKFGQDLARANFGLKKGLYDQIGGLAGQFGQVGGQSKAQPSITRGPIFTPDQIQQQVNTQTAGNDARYQTLMRQLGSSNASRGFGASSPAMQAQMTRLGIANIGENARTSRELPMQYAQSNADSVFRTDQLADQQWREDDDSDIRRRQMQMQGYNSLLNTLGGLA